MYNQLKKSGPDHYHHWRIQEKIYDLEKILDSDYLNYMDPNLVLSMKKIIQNEKQKNCIPP